MEKDRHGLQDTTSIAHFAMSGCQGSPVRFTGSVYWLCSFGLAVWVYSGTGSSGSARLLAFCLAQLANFICATASQSELRFEPPSSVLT